MRGFLRLLMALALIGLAYVIFSALETLQTLDSVEAERDGWQRPGHIVEALDLHPGNLVIDLGSGAGYFALKLSPVVGAQGSVLAVDLRKLSLSFLWVRSVLKALHNIRVIPAEEENPRLPVNAADAVLIANAYHEFRNPPVMLEYVFKALRSGGRLVIVDRGPRTTERAGGTGQGHDVTMAAAQQQIRAHGFYIARSEDPFIDRPEDDPWWLLVAFKP